MSWRRYRYQPRWFWRITLRDEKGYEKVVHTSADGVHSCSAEVAAKMAVARAYLARSDRQFGGAVRLWFGAYLEGGPWTYMLLDCVAKKVVVRRIDVSCQQVPASDTPWKKPR